MKRQEGLIVFDHNMNYYFSDGEQITILSKKAPSKEYEIASSKLIRVYDTLFSRALINGDEKYRQHSFYRMMAFDFSSVDEETKYKILELVKEWFVELEIMEQRGLTLVFYFSELDSILEMMLETINYDFGTNIKLLSTGKLSFRNKNAFVRILDVYLKYSHKKQHSFTNIKRLIMDVSRESDADLKNLREPILGDIAEDEQLKNMIFTLFSNNLNVTKTANQAYMHRNTINNKLNYIYEITSLNLQVFHDAVAMFLLLSV